MKKLVKGILEFRQKLLPQYRENFAHLALGQSPDTLFIACSDSRVVPNLFASTNPGDLFVIRNVGNLIPTFNSPSSNGEAAAIEFALTNLPIENIIVCGHSECAAMKAVALGVDQSDEPHLKAWLSHCRCSLSPSEKETVSLSPHNILSQKNVLEQMEHLKTYPLVQEKIKNNSLQIHGWYFDIATGDVYAYEEEFKQFTLIDEKEAARILERLS
jgi:carbonic anhydrase